MRLALWAQHQPSNELTPERIGAVLGVELATAVEWRADLMAVLSPMIERGTSPIPPLGRSEPASQEPTP